MLTAVDLELSHLAGLAAAMAGAWLSPTSWRVSPVATAALLAAS